MTEIILHNYPESPVAEKVRIALGIKNIAWSSVKIPRIPPKPLLLPLTGGYRRTPVMQIGADIFCDSQCILAELEQRFPTPSLFPGSNGPLIGGLGRLADGLLFDLSVKLVLGASAGKLPPDWAEDRGRLYLGQDWTKGLQAAHDAVPHLATQMRGTLADFEAQLSDGRRFLTGERPSLIDAQIHQVTWFLRGRWQQGAQLLSEFPNLETWEKSVIAIGHGHISEMSAEAALEVARSAEPVALNAQDAKDPQGLKPDQKVSITPDVDGGEQPVEGTIVAASSERITVRRNDPDVGQVNVHFPRVGYRVDVLT